jgi:signal transduction histidine kinase
MTAPPASTTTGYRPRAGWRQAPRDLAYLLPGLLIAVTSFCLLITGFFLGLGLIPLALLGLFILIGTLYAARGFAAAERGRVGMMEGRTVGPVYHRTTFASGLSGVVGRLRDPQTWREWGHGVLILPVRVITWSLTIAWTAAALMVTYPLWAWSLPRGTHDKGLAELIFGWESFNADVIVNTALGLVFLVVLPYVLRALATVESSLAWGLLTNENDALRARAAQLTRSREAVVQAEADTLRRVERDIHDGPQQRLVRLTMDLETAQRRMADDPAAATPLIEGALTQTQEALTELRALSRGIAPPILTDRGLHAALASAAARCPVPVELDVQLGASQRLAPAVRTLPTL